MSSHDIDAIAEAVAEKLKDKHTCRFSEDEAKAMHNFADTLTKEQVNVLALLAHGVTKAGSIVGTAIIVALLIGAMWVLVVLAKKGFFPLPFVN